MKNSREILPLEDRIEYTNVDFEDDLIYVEKKHYAKCLKALEVAEEEIEHLKQENFKLSEINYIYRQCQRSFEKLSEDEICKKCQFWEVDDCMDFKGYKTLILAIQDKIDNSPITVTDSIILNEVTELINNFFKIK
jgi:hypothetical protein